MEVEGRDGSQKYMELRDFSSHLADSHSGENQLQAFYSISGSLPEMKAEEAPLFWNVIPVIKNMELPLPEEHSITGRYRAGDVHSEHRHCPWLGLG